MANLEVASREELSRLAQRCLNQLETTRSWVAFQDSLAELRDFGINPADYLDLLACEIRCLQQDIKDLRRHQGLDEKTRKNLINTRQAALKIRQRK